jgi:hypothetical protein
MSRPQPLNVLMVEDSETDAELLLRELLRKGFTPSATRVETSDALRDALTSGRGTSSSPTTACRTSTPPRR